MVMAWDPWIPSNSSAAPKPDSNSFEDDFVNPNALPDSAEYIASLERKLERIRKARGQTSKDLLKSLEERRQDAIARLLTENHAGAPSETEEYADENVPTKWLKNYLNPEQPLTVGELVQLVKADYLAQEVEKKDLDSADDLSLSSVKLEDAPAAEQPAEEKIEGPADEKTEGNSSVEEQN